MDKIAILERDNWTCKLCGVATPKELRGTVHPHAPEVDHIIPRSRDGNDEPENLRCVCRSCNQKKLSYTDEELNTCFTPDGVPIDLVVIEKATAKQREGWKKWGRVAALIANSVKNEKGQSVNAVKGGQAAKRYFEEHPEEAVNNGKKGGAIRAQFFTLYGVPLTREDRQRGGFTRRARGDYQSKEHCERVSRVCAHTNHVRWHEKRGIVNPNCKFCKPAEVQQIAAD